MAAPTPPLTREAVAFAAMAIGRGLGIEALAMLMHYAALHQLSDQITVGALHLSTGMPDEWVRRQLVELIAAGLIRPIPELADEVAEMAEIRAAFEQKGQAR